MNSKTILITIALIVLVIQIEAFNNRKIGSSHVRIDFNNARRNRRQSGYQYDKPKISFDLPNNRGTKPSDQSTNGYPSGQPSLQPSGKSPDLSQSGYPKDSPPTNSLLPIDLPQSGGSNQQSGGYPSETPGGNAPNSYSYNKPVIDAPSQQPGGEVAKPDANYIPPDSSAAPPIGSTKGPEYLPPKPPSDSYTPNQNPGGMVIVVADTPQTIDSSTPGSKYLPPFSTNPGSPPKSGPPKSKYVPPPDDLASLPAPGKPPTSSYVPPNSGGGAPTGGNSAPAPQAPNSLYNGPNAISSPASTYLPPYQ